MIIEKFFPTFVYAKDVELDNNKLTQDIVNWSNQDKGVQKTNHKGWHSTTDMGNKPEYQLLVTELLRMQKEIYDNEHIDRYARLGNMWANINPTYSYNKTHTHPNSMWSGVYYIKVPKKSGHLYLEDPRPGPNTHMPRRVKDMPEALWRVCAYEPVEGRMIFFPSWLPHGVDINMNTDKGEKNWRISVSYNFIQL